MANILFLVHIEEEFRKIFPDRMYLNRIRKAQRSRKYDRIIFLNSDIGKGICEELKYPYSIEEWDWGWGYEPCMFDWNEEEKKYCIEAKGHEWTYVCPELRGMAGWLKNCKVYVGGGARSECLRDWEDCLEHLGIGYSLVEGYIFG